MKNTAHTGHSLGIASGRVHDRVGLSGDITAGGARNSAVSLVEAELRAAPSLGTLPRRWETAREGAERQTIETYFSFVDILV